MDIPKPSEPHRKLEKFAGKWTGDEKLRPAGPWKPSGEKAKGTFNFHEAAEKGCPISRLLNTKITMEAKLEG